jgi:hypothetical protein
VLPQIRTVPTTSQRPIGAGAVDDGVHVRGSREAEKVTGHDGYEENWVVVAELA